MKTSPVWAAALNDIAGARPPPPAHIVNLKETGCLSSLRFSLLADDTGIIQSIPAKQL
jgi:hypothetical protein